MMAIRNGNERKYLQVYFLLSCKYYLLQIIYKIYYTNGNWNCTFTFILENVPLKKTIFLRLWLEQWQVILNFIYAQIILSNNINNLKVSNKWMQKSKVCIRTEILKDIPCSVLVSLHDLYSLTIFATVRR